MSHFRYVYLAASEGGDSKLISEPLALARLALFLIDVNRANKKWSGARARPLLILAEPPATYLVVGVNCSEAASERSSGASSPSASAKKSHSMTSYSACQKRHRGGRLFPVKSSHGNGHGSAVGGVVCGEDINFEVRGVFSEGFLR